MQHPVTKTLVKFMNKELTTVMQHMKPVEFSNISIHFLEKIFRNMKLAQTMWLRSSLKYSIVKKLERGKNHDVIPAFARDEIENIMWNKKGSGFHCKFSIFERDIDIYMFGSNMTRDFFEIAVKRIYLWLYVAFIYSPDHCSRQLKCYIYLTDLCKKMPAKGEPIGTVNANTAFTTTCREHTEINIFRHEEWFKVLIHESFHCLGLDFSTLDTTNANNEILTMFPVESVVNLSETYCEVFAELLNVMFIVFYSFDNMDKMKVLIDKTGNLLNYETLFSSFQCCKVLNHYDMTYDDLINNNGTEKYEERTNVLSYYIIKNVLFYHIDEFVKWCSKNNDKKGISFNGEKGLVKYCGLIGEHYKNKDFTDVLNVLDDWFRNGNMKDEKNENDVFVMKTMRMSMIE